VEHPEWYKKDEHGGFKKASGMDDIIELDFSKRAMRQAMIEAMKFWVDTCDIDGFRCDLAYWVALDFWLEAKSALNEVKPLFWLAEADFVDHPDYARVFDAAYTWHWMHRAKDYSHQQLSFHDLLHVLHRYGQAPGIKAWFTSNHDENTWNGTEYEKYDYMAKALAVFSCTWPGLPLIYSGQEIPNQKRISFFDKDHIEWKEEIELHHFYQTLLHLQTNHPALHVHAALEKIKTTADDKVLAFQRCFGRDKVFVLINFSNHPVEVLVHDQRFYGSFADVFKQPPEKIENRHFHLEAGGFTVLKN
jgi:glycosidase